MREIIQAEVEKQLYARVCEPLKSKWAAPVLFAPKKDGTLRFFVDYRKLNTASLRDSYPLPRITSVFNLLRTPRYYRHWTRTVDTGNY